MSSSGMNFRCCEIKEPLGPLDLKKNVRVHRASGQCGGPGYSNTSREGWTGTRFSPWHHRGTRRTGACTVVPPLVP